MTLIFRVAGNLRYILLRRTSVRGGGGGPHSMKALGTSASGSHGKFGLVEMERVAGCVSAVRTSPVGDLGR